MRKAISGGLIWTGLVTAFVATAYYIYFIWGQDWSQIYLTARDKDELDALCEKARKRFSKDRGNIP